jgi:hypothetical protein
MTAFLARLPKTTFVYVALFLALVAAAGGGYALAASKTKTITVCADKKTGVLHLKTRGRCKRSQTRVTWNQQGPQGPQGVAGQPGAPAAAAWAHVLASGAVFAGEGISIQHQAVGSYQLTVTASACAQQSNAPVITVDDSPPNSQGPGVFPVAWIGAVGSNEFDVFTGAVSGGSFSAADHEFYVVDECP